MNEITIPWLDFGLKYAVLMFGMYYLFMRCLSEKFDRNKAVASFFFSSAMGYSLIWLRMKLGLMHLALLLIYFILTNCLMYRKDTDGREERAGRPKLGDIVVLSLLCFAFCEALFMLVGLASSAVLSVFYYNLVPDDSNSVWGFLNNTPVHTAAYLVMIAMVWITTWFMAGMKRLRQGLWNIVEHREAGTAIMFAVLMLIAVMSFGGSYLSGNHQAVSSILFLITIAFCVCMPFWIKGEIKADYVRRIRHRNLVLMEGSLAEKDREIASLSDDNEKLAEVIRRDSELLRVITDGLKNGGDSERTEKAAAEVERLYGGRSDAVHSLESHGRSTFRTGDSTVDAILLFMAYKAEKKGVDFTVKADPDAKPCFGEKIERREFNTILADLTENAIISAGAVKDRRVEVMFRRNGQSLRLEVLDSGEMFDTEVLRKMGSQRVTTHAGEGGSGIGLMTLFGILRTTGASFEIEEYPLGEENPDGKKYNKSVGVTFDGKGRLRLVTDRADELKQSLKSGRFEISKRTE